MIELDLLVRMSLKSRVKTMFLCVNNEFFLD